MPFCMGEDEYYYTLDELEYKHPIVAFFHGVWLPIDLFMMMFFPELSFKYLFSFLFKEPDIPAKEAYLKKYGKKGAG